MTQEIINYNFAKEFAVNPGLRFKRLSPGSSGEEFRENVLEDILQNNKKIIINIDDIESAMGASFLSEAFGNIAVKYGIEKFKKSIEILAISKKGQVTNTEMIKRVDEAIRRDKEK